MAETRVALDPAATAGRLPSSNLLNELQVHQVELEMQVAELQRTQAALEEARDRYRDLYDFAPVGYLTLSTVGVIREANLIAASLLNEDRKTLVGQPFAAFVGRDGDKWHQFLEKVVRREASLACDLTVQRGDGSAFDGHLACDYRATGETGPSLRVILTDVEQRRIEAQRLDAFQAAIEGLPIGVTAGGESPDGVLTLTNWNPAFEEIVGAPLAQGVLSALPVRTYRPDRTTRVPPEEFPGPQAARTGRVIRDVELHVQRPDGEWVVLLTSAAPLGGPEGVHRHAVAVTLDITDRRRAEDALRTSEAHFRQLVTSLPMPVAFSNSRGEFVTINDKWTQVLGYTLDDIPTVAEWFQKAYPDESYRRWAVETWTRLVDEAAKRGGEVAPGDYRVTCKDGTVRTMSISGVRIGENLLVTMLDVTGRKRAEDALRASEIRFRRLVAGLPIGIFQANADQGCTFMNEAGQQIVGLTEAQALGSGWKRALHPEDAGRVAALWSDVVAKEGSFSSEYRLVRPDGQIGWVKGWATALPSDSEGKLEIVGAIVDITARKGAEEALRESDAKLRAFTNAVPDPIFVKDREGRRLFANEALCRLFGKRAEEILGKTDMEVHENPEIRVAVMENDRRIMASGVAEVVEETVLTPSGPRIFHSTKVPYRDQTGEIVGIVASAHDITNRRQMEDALRASEQRYRSVVASMAEGVVVRNADGTVVACNESAERILGLTEGEMKERPARDPDWNGIREDGTTMSPADHPALVALRTGQPQLHVVTGLRTAEGTAAWILSNSEPLFDPSGRVQGVVTTMSDITEPRALRQQLAVSSRLAALGTLVAGVAHEINNPLAAELADQGLALEVVKQVRDRLRGHAPFDREVKAGLLDEVVEVLEEAQGAGQRIARIVKDLATFGRPDATRTRTRLAEVVDDAVRALPVAVATVASVMVQDHGAPDVMASSGQIEQVVTNLVSNAAKATTPGKQGEIVVRLGPGTPGMARLEVSDHGVGIAPAMKDRVFEPFFTTRPVGEGRGTGLGLAICHAIAVSHGGMLTVESEVGKGSTFRLELPAATDGPMPGV